MKANHALETTALHLVKVHVMKFLTGIKPDYAFKHLVRSLLTTKNEYRRFPRIKACKK